MASATLVMGQRPQFAGSRPIGYPELYNRTTTTADGLEDRFGEGTTQRLPIEANGDRDLVDRLSKLPVDQQPFWFINWQALEANRENPQTYPQKPNVFVDPISPSGANPPIRSTQTNSQSVSSVRLNSQSSVSPNSQSSVGLSSRNGEPVSTFENNEALVSSHTQTSTQTSRDNTKISSRNYYIQNPTNVHSNFKY
ncbi:uncharacterized protein ACR2FA_000138 [Aphomia sociella]